ncbi:hypothetical protein ACA910_007859 [Epithemia clementina (nom. ined.)]
MGLGMWFLRNLRTAMSDTFAHHYNNHEIDVDMIWAAESQVALAMAAQMNLWPPSLACTWSSSLSSSSLSSRPPPFLSRHEVSQEISKFYYSHHQESNKALNQTPPQLGALGRRLLQRSVALNRTLLTFQIGAGMEMAADGNDDPMHLLFVLHNENENDDDGHSKNKIENAKRNYNQEDEDVDVVVANKNWLQHWMPIVVETNAHNFEKLNYTFHHNRSFAFGLLQQQSTSKFSRSQDQQQQQVSQSDNSGGNSIPSCKWIEHWAISYNKNNDNNNHNNNNGKSNKLHDSNGAKANTCDFCRFNSNFIIPNSSTTTAKAAVPPQCQEQPDWVKTQMGTIPCQHAHQVLKTTAHDDAVSMLEECLVRESVPCGTTLELLQRRLGDENMASRIAILQILGIVMERERDHDDNVDNVDVNDERALWLLPLLILQELDEHLYEWPPVIQYESKHLRHQGSTNEGKNSRALEELHQLLQNRGYVIYQGPQYDLAIQVVSS